MNRFKTSFLFAIVSLLALCSCTEHVPIRESADGGAIEADGGGGDASEGDVSVCGLDDNFVQEQSNLSVNRQGYTSPPVAGTLPNSLNSLYLDANGFVFDLSLDGGKTWTVQSTLAGFSDISYAPPLHVVASDQQRAILFHVARETAEPQVVTNEIYRTIDGGASFSLVHSFDGTRYGSALISSNTDGRVVLGYVQRAIGDAQRAFLFTISDDFGATWQTREAFKDNAQDSLVGGVLVDQQGTLIFKGYRNNSDTPGAFVSRSTDGGLSWQRVRENEGQNYFVGEMRAIGDDTIVSLEYSVPNVGGILIGQTRTILISKDSGLTWRTVFQDAAGDTYNLGREFHGIEVAPDGQIFVPGPEAVENYELLTSSDEGLSWEAITLTAPGFFPVSTHFWKTDTGWDLLFFSWTLSDATTVGASTYSASCR